MLPMDLFLDAFDHVSGLGGRVRARALVSEQIPIFPAGCETLDDVLAQRLLTHGRDLPATSAVLTMTACRVDTWMQQSGPANRRRG
jgi:hypothetical protein